MTDPLVRRRPAHPPLLVELLTAAAAAAVATQVKVWAEGALQPVAERVLPPSETERQEKGADPDGHADNMPPQVLVDRLAEAAGDHEPSDTLVSAGSQATHWALGVGAGVVYGMLARRVPWVRAGRGALFGSALFAGTHGSVVPALGLQGRLSRMPSSWWVWEPGSHLVYGVATDLGLSAADALVARLRA